MTSMVTAEDLASGVFVRRGFVDRAEMREYYQAADWVVPPPYATDHDRGRFGQSAHRVHLANLANTVAWYSL